MLMSILQKGLIVWSQKNLCSCSEKNMKHANAKEKTRKKKKISSVALLYLSFCYCYEYIAFSTSSSNIPEIFWKNSTPSPHPLTLGSSVCSAAEMHMYMYIYATNNSSCTYLVHLIISNKHYTVVAKNYTFNNDGTLFISTSTITKLFIKRINDINWPEKHQFYFAHDIPGTKIGIEQKITHRTHSSEQNNSSNFW